MLDPITSLAFSMHATKGVYAVLLGSGVSRAARIPTGWEITLELVRKVAALQSADAGADPAAWFREKFSAEPDYSQLLDAVAKTPAERQQLLRSYWEPTEAEREDGAKQPTAAHRAIANLVKAGFIRVILTTNFDRLTELSLQDVGIQPTVLASPDHIEGAMPLIHNPCTVIKVHGDYLDTRIRNTPAELAAYPKELNTLLDRVFDEFGLIVCGWSSDWDEALRSAITRAPSRRFTTYWAIRGQPSEAAQALIQRRAAMVVPIPDADGFFNQLGEKVQALASFAQPHPLSTEVALASVKKYLSSPAHRIQLDDLVCREVERVIKAVDGPQFSVEDREINTESVERRIRAYEAACETLMHMAYVSGRWGTASQTEVWARAFVELAQDRAQGGVVFWIGLQRYPATLLMYSFCLGALASENYESAALLLRTKVYREHSSDRFALQLTVPARIDGTGLDGMKILPGMARRHTPLSDWLQERLRAVAKREYLQDRQYILAFDRLEVVLSLNYGQVVDPQDRWFPMGCFGWREHTRRHVIAALREAIGAKGAGAPIVIAGLIGRTPAECSALLEAFETFVGRLHW